MRDDVAGLPFAAGLTKGGQPIEAVGNGDPEELNTIGVACRRDTEVSIRRQVIHPCMRCGDPRQPSGVIGSRNGRSSRRPLAADNQHGGVSLGLFGRYSVPERLTERAVREASSGVIEK
jgi:hypothetical protein